MDVYTGLTGVRLPATVRGITEGHTALTLVLEHRVPVSCPCYSLSVPYHAPEALGTLDLDAKEFGEATVTDASGSPRRLLKD